MGRKGGSVASLTSGQIEGLLPERLPKLTPDTITDRTELLAELERVRTPGVAFACEEHTAGISAVGAAIQDAGGIVAASARFADREDHPAQMLLRTCTEVSATPDSNGRGSRVPMRLAVRARSRGSA